MQILEQFSTIKILHNLPTLPLEQNSCLLIVSSGRGWKCLPPTPEGWKLTPDQICTAAPLHCRLRTFYSLRLCLGSLSFVKSSAV